MTMIQAPAISRRHFCLCCAAAAAGGWLSPQQAYAQAVQIVQTIQQAAAKATIISHKLRGNITVLEGSGGNIAVITGPDGKLLVDAGIGVSKPAIIKALAAVSNAPVQHLINTHWHFDHADGNEWLHGVGATIVAHENTRKHLMVAQRVEDWDYTFPQPAASALPAEVFAKDKTMQVNGHTLEMAYYGPAHTDSDISVRFKEADVIHVGDTWWNGIYPFIDYSTGGNIDGSIRAIEANLAMTSDRTTVIPGHGPIGDKSGMRDYRDMLVAVRDTVGRLKQQGKTLQETIAARPSAAYDAKWGQFVIGPALFTRLVYEGV
jgi:glyoxylase-like metal-dependent hydrolase (beta-lactamase superfamily II)